MAFKPVRSAAVAALIAGFGVGEPHAVYLNPGGQGQALLFAYYTARASSDGTFNTYVSIKNTRGTVVAKVRFREGRNSRVVAEFNLYLTSGDAWTAAVVPDGDGARLVTRDRSCTNPPIPPEGLVFSTRSFADGDDQAGTGRERTAEGHLEVIEMAAISTTAPIHPRNPRQDCAKVQGASPDLGPLEPPLGRLTGSATLIDLERGLDVSYVPETLAALTSSPFYSAPGQPGTDFDAPQVDPVSHVTLDHFAYRMVWNRGIDAVNSVLMSEFFENDFVLDPETDSRTDWVMTFPTRRFFVGPDSASWPFGRPFVPPAVGLPCEGLRPIGMWDREAAYVEYSNFPLRPPSETRVCWSAAAFPIRSGEVIRTSSSDVLGAANTLGWSRESFRSSGRSPREGLHVPSEFQNGAIRVDFDTLGGARSLPSSSWIDLRTGAMAHGEVGIIGFPAIGFMVRTFRNATLTCGASACQRHYASAFPHRRITRVIQIPQSR